MIFQLHIGQASCQIGSRDQRADHQGQILANDHGASRLLEMKPAPLAGQVGTVFQDPRSQFFMTDTTRELAFGCENMGLPREETIDRIAKAAKDLELADYLNRSIFALSSGEKDRSPWARSMRFHRGSSADWGAG